MIGQIAFILGLWALAFGGAFLFVCLPPSYMMVLAFVIAVVGSVATLVI